MPWYDLIPSASNERTLTRARRAMGRNTIYSLGRGGMQPAVDLDQRCDCSGFVAWAIGIPRQIPPGTGHWLDTDAYARGGAPALPGLLVEIPPGQAQPGDVIVYPDYTDAGGRRRQGHMGIVSQVDGEGNVTRVIHCSTSNSRAGDAVQETPPTPWQRRRSATRVMRVDYGRLQERFVPGHEPSSAPAASPLRHPMLAGDPVLQAVASGSRPPLRATGRPVEGTGPLHDAFNRLGARFPELRVDLGADGRFHGYFGPKTEQAVKNFQASRGLETDGRVGRDTVLALDATLLAFDEDGAADPAPVDPPAAEPGVD